MCSLPSARSRWGMRMCGKKSSRRPWWDKSRDTYP
jgi:hypothetical protein